MTPEQQTIIEYKRLLYQAVYSEWINNHLFTFRWWVLLLFFACPWIIWYLLVDKCRIKELLLYLIFTSGVAILMDETGASLTLWAYPVKLLPVLPRLITVNYSMVPIIFALIYQYFPGWKSFIIVNVILALVFSFILEPVLVWAKLYYLIKWKYIYSAPTYFITAISLKWLIERIKLIQTHAIKA